MKKFILGIAIALVTVFFVVYLIQTFYPAPKYDDFCKDDFPKLINDSEIWENHSDLFIDEMSLEFISARVIGREIGKILESNLKLKDRIISLLNSDENKNFSMISQTIALHLNNTIENSIKLLQEIVSGIEDNHFD